MAAVAVAGLTHDTRVAVAASSGRPSGSGAVARTSSREIEQRCRSSSPGIEGIRRMMKTKSSDQRDPKDEKIHPPMNWIRRKRDRVDMKFGLRLGLAGREYARPR